MKIHHVLIAILALAPAVKADIEMQKTMLTEPGEFSAVWLPTSSHMVGALVESAGTAQLLAHFSQEEASIAYGFAAASISKERGSFGLGILLTNLKITLRAHDTVQTARAIDALVAGLVELKAPEPLVKGAVTMGAALNGGVGTDVLYKVSLPLLEPFIEAFVEQEGLVGFLRLGEWVEASRLALASSEQGKSEAAVLLLTRLSPALHFLSSAEDLQLPAGGVAALEILKNLAGEAKLSDAKLQEARVAIEQLAISMR